VSPRVIEGYLPRAIQDSPLITLDVKLPISHLLNASI
jgi:hypothetical protein